mmetsp:Transcript_19675/g.44442  ORF Transcript_19675/g.44442 Transcript_19675/m.44442 type:complete len:233 (-) Transcript_19675:49-747(-)
MCASSSRASAMLVMIMVSMGSSFGFTIYPSSSSSGKRGTALFGGKEDEEMGTFELASWYAVEAFGRVFGGSKKTDVALESVDSDIDVSRQPLSLDETLQRIQLDNDRSYFLSGEIDEMIYDEQCTFADPFVSFDGRQRFVDNLANLGSFITDYSAKTINYDVSENGKQIQTKVMVKLELNLPWKPVLAWPWGVKYVIDEATFLITDHIESWDVSPSEGIAQIFRRPTTQIKR